MGKDALGKRTGFITINHFAFHLWKKKHLVKNQKVSKRYDHACNDFACSISLGANSYAFGTRENMFSVPKKTVGFSVFAELNDFLGCMVSVRSEIYLSKFQTLNHPSNYKFVSLEIVNFWVNTH